MAEMICSSFRLTQNFIRKTNKIDHALPHQLAGTGCFSQTQASR